jgi:hypothetical protein
MDVKAALLQFLSSPHVDAADVMPLLTAQGVDSLDDAALLTDEDFVQMGVKLGPPPPPRLPPTPPPPLLPLLPLHPLLLCLMNLSLQRMCRKNRRRSILMRRQVANNSSPTASGWSIGSTWLDGSLWASLWAIPIGRAQSCAHLSLHSSLSCAPLSSHSSVRTPLSPHCSQPTLMVVCAWQVQGSLARVWRG